MEKKLVINTEFTFIEKYLPSNRHRKEVERIGRDSISLAIREFDELPIAFIVSEHDKKESYYSYDDRLWVRENRGSKYSGAKGWYSVDDLVKDFKKECGCGYFHSYQKTDKESRMDDLLSMANDYIIIGSGVYKTIGEPRYVVMTFGLGHNHGGTHISIDNSYNGNISKNRYFSALHKKEAVSFAKEVARGREDTDFVRGVCSGTDIKVLMPSLVKCNPSVEHGDGCTFINQVEGMIQGSSSVAEAGLLAICSGISVKYLVE